MEMMATALDDRGIAHRVVGDETLFDVVFTGNPVTNYRDVLGADQAAYAAFNRTLRDNGIFKPPGKLYPSLALTDEDLDRTDAAIRVAAEALGAGQAG